MPACNKTSQVCLFILSLVFWTGAGIFFYGGTWIFETYHHYDQLTTASMTLIPACIAFVIGIIFFIVGVVGIVATIKKSRVLLSIYFILLLIIMTAEVSAAALGYLYRNDVKEAVENGLTKAVNNYNTSVNHDQVDYIQSKLHCCGVINGPLDWKKSGWYQKNPNHVPTSCCKTGLNTTCTGDLSLSDELYESGCYQVLLKKFLDNLTYITVAGITFAILQIMGLTTICILCCHARSGMSYELLSNGVGSSGLVA